MVSTDNSSTRIIYFHMVAQMQEKSPSVTPTMTRTSSMNSPAYTGWTLVVRKVSKPKVAPRHLYTKTPKTSKATKGHLYTKAPKTSKATKASKAKAPLPKVCSLKNHMPSALRSNTTMRCSIMGPPRYNSRSPLNGPITSTIKKTYTSEYAYSTRTTTKMFNC